MLSGGACPARTGDVRHARPREALPGHESNREEHMNNAWQELSQSLAGALERARPSLVRIEGRRAPATGVVWADGVVITTSHAVRRDEGIRVGQDGESTEATLAGRDPSTDLAVLRAALPGARPAAWADTAAIRVGSLVLVGARPG